MKEQKPQRSRWGRGRGFCLTTDPLTSCEVEATVELMTVGLAELVNAKIERREPKVSFWTYDQAVLVSERDRLAALEETPPAGDDGAYHRAEQVEALAMLVTLVGTAPTRLSRWPLIAALALPRRMSRTATIRHRAYQALKLSPKVHCL